MPSGATTGTFSGVKTKLGVTGAEGSEGCDAPAAFRATTVNVYATPLVSPLTAHEVVEVAVHDRPEGLDDTVYPVMGLPPSLVGAAHVT